MAKKTETENIEKNTEKKHAPENVKKSSKTAVKKEKKVKLLPAKKLPGFYRKKFTEKDFEKKVLKKIYIEADKKLVGSQFKKEKDKKGREFLAFDRSAKIPKNEFIRCKKIAVDLKNQKAGIKLVPLLAVVCLFAAIGISVTLFKNIVVKKGLTATMQEIFGAKTDIQKVDLQIFGASLEISGLAQASSESPMKNIFEIDKIDVAFNLTDLLRGKFHAKNIEVSGVAIDTERKTSGELARKPKAKKQKEVVADTKKDSDSIMNAAADQLKKMFESYNPETMLSNIQNELKSPAVANSIASDVNAKVEKWKNVPNEYQASIAKLSASVDSLVKTNWENITNAATLKKAISDIETAMNESNSLKKKMSATSRDIKTDTNAVNGYSRQLQNAIKADSSLVDSKISEMKKLFSADGLKNILTEGVRGIILEKAGKFYPYIDQALTAAMNSKGNSNEAADSKKSAEKTEKKAKKAEKSTGHARSAGRTVYYKKDTVPKLLIENVVASGYEYKSNELLFKGTATEISSDQNMRGKPAKINADFKVMGKPNKASVTIDARDNSAAPLVLADYSGKGYPVSANAQVFSLSSASDIDAVLTCKKDGSFTVGGTLNMNITEIQGMDFEPAKVSGLYKKAVSGIKNLSVGFRVLYSKNGALNVELTDIEKLTRQLVTPVTQALASELNSIASEAQANVAKVLGEKTGIASEQIAAFTDISGLLNNQMNSLNSLQKRLEDQKTKINRQLSNAAKGAAVDALKKFKF